MGFIFPYKSKVISISTLNDDILLLKLEKPFGFKFKLGQVVDLSIHKPGYELAVATFTIANNPTDIHLEFIVKVYHRKGLTEGISQLQPNDIVQISYAWDSFSYKGNGTFIAAGAGITAFLPIFETIKVNRIDVKQEHRLIYADKSKNDVLYYKRLKEMFSNNLSVILSRSKARNLAFGRIDLDYLSKIISTTQEYFYICGPRRFEEDVKSHLIRIGVKRRNIQTGYNI